MSTWRAFDGLTAAPMSSPVAKKVHAKFPVCVKAPSLRKDGVDCNARFIIDKSVEGQSENRRVVVRVLQNKAIAGI